MAISREPIRAEVRRILLTRLLAGELKPGTRINETTLATELGVSRTPLREALIHLELEGFIESAQGKGFSVAPLNAKVALDLHSLVGLLESVATAALADLSESEFADVLDEMEVVNRKLAQRVEEGPDGNADQLMELGNRWHALLVGACDNDQLREMLRLLKARLYRYTYYFIEHPRLISCSLEQHGTILQALRNREFDAAVRLVRQHWMLGVDDQYEWLHESEAAAAGEEGREGS